MGTSIKVEIDPNEKLPDRYLGTDEDGPSYGPKSLYECIIDAAVAHLIGYGEKAVTKLVAETMHERIIASVDGKLPAIIEKALSEPVEVSDGYRSEKKSIRDLIGARVKEQVGHREGSYGRDTVLDETVRTMIDGALQKELREHVKAAKAELTATLQAKASEMLAAETLREAGIR